MDDDWDRQVEKTVRPGGDPFVIVVAEGGKRVRYVVTADCPGAVPGIPKAGGEDPGFGDIFGPGTTPIGALGERLSVAANVLFRGRVGR